MNHSHWVAYFFSETEEDSEWLQHGNFRWLLLTLDTQKAQGSGIPMVHYWFSHLWINTWVLIYPCSHHHLGSGNSHLLPLASSISHVRQASGMVSPLSSKGLWGSLQCNANGPLQLTFSLASEPCGNVFLSWRDLKLAKEGHTNRILVNRTTLIIPAMNTLTVLPAGGDV